MIKAPGYQKDAIPTRKGWVHPKTGEILVGGSISQRDIDEYIGSVAKETLPAVQEVVVEETVLIQDPPSEIDWEVEEIDLDSMTKAQLIETAEEWEIDIDPKDTKAQIKTILEEELY